MHLDGLVQVHVMDAIGVSPLYSLVLIVRNRNRWQGGSSFLLSVFFLFSFSSVGLAQGGRVRTFLLLRILGSMIGNECSM